MKKENTLLLISAILSVSILLLSFFLSNKNKIKEDIPEIKKDTNIEQVKEEKKDPPQVVENVPSFLHSAWIPAWDFENGYSSLEKYKGDIGEINPVFYGVNSDGTLLNRKPSEQSVQKLLSFATKKYIEVIPTVGSYDFKVMRSLLQSEAYIEKHISEILKEVEKYNFDGVDIDYEKIYSSEKEGYFKFLTDLKTALHAKEKILSVTVVAKIRDGTQDTLAVQDWERIDKIADRIKIMTYDFTLQTSTTAGPIAPINWMEDVIEYAKERIDSKKISLGVHLYAYLWKDTKASALTETSVANILKNSNIQREYKKDIAEGYAQYKCSDGATCTLFYQTEEGVLERIKLAKESNLLGVSYWRLGKELDLLSKAFSD
ncbi:MAG: glycosyl hydrolase family 18 protein [Candidatus Dojkabacteria bacterium]